MTENRSCLAHVDGVLKVRVTKTGRIFCNPGRLFEGRYILATLPISEASSLTCDLVKSMMELSQFPDKNSTIGYNEALATMLGNESIYWTASIIFELADLSYTPFASAHIVNSSGRTLHTAYEELSSEATVGECLEALKRQMRIATVENEKAGFTLLDI